MRRNSTDLRSDATAIARAALEAVDPRTLVASALEGEAGAALRRFEAWQVCAVGKAARRMLDALGSAGGGRLRGAVLATGPHPVPGAESLATAQRARLAAHATDDRCALVLLLSGGASAMMALPAGDLTLDDKIAMSAAMLAGGVPIEQMNTVRKHLSAVKGGWLAAEARRCCTLAISDVIGPAENDPSVIGSGPGVPDASTFADAVDALRRFNLWDAAPPRVRDHLARGERGQVEETPKPGDPRLRGARWFVIGSRRDAMRGARAAAERLGYHVIVVEEPVLGEARSAGPAVIARAAAQVGGPGPVCVISSGETTVRVRGGGRGGRNQELALAALPALEAMSSDVVLASVGTDGVDGPTDAAGALAARDSLSRAHAIGAPPVETVLQANDSYSYFDRLGDLLRTGPTGTNVGDLQIVCLG